MQEFDIIKQVVQVAFSSGKLSNLEENKLILITLEKIEDKLKRLASLENQLLKNNCEEETTRP
jgi:hypothetical protein